MPERKRSGWIERSTRTQAAVECKIHATAALIANSRFQSQNTAYKLLTFVIRLFNWRMNATQMPGPGPRILTQAKNRMEFVRNCFLAFGIRNSWHLFRLLHSRQAGHGSTVHIPAEFTGAPLVLRPGTPDVEAFYRIFAWREYHLPPDFLPRRVRSVVDLGANIGLSVFYFASRFPTAQIIGLEPDPACYELLRANLTNRERLALIHAGIWNRRCSLVVEPEAARPGAACLRECSPNTPGSVSAFSVPDLLEEHHLDEVDILKADLRDAEEKVFCDGCEQWLPRVRTLIIECHRNENRDRLVPKIGPFFKRHIRRPENDVFGR